MSGALWKWVQGVLAAATAAGMLGCAGAAGASETPFGVWRPFSTTALAVGRITIAPDGLRLLATGAEVPLAAVEGKPGVFALTGAPSDARQRIGCGPLRVTHLTLYAGAEGMLNLKVYAEGGRPRMPTEENRLAIKGGCALYNFVR